MKNPFRLILGGGGPVEANPAGLKFFNGLFGLLKLDAAGITGMDWRVHLTEALPLNTPWKMEFSRDFSEEAPEPEETSWDLELRPLTEEEWSRPVLVASSIVFWSGWEEEESLTRVWDAPASGIFVVRDLAGIVEQIERAYRGSLVARDHIFWEGIYPDARGFWSSAWGS